MASQVAPAQLEPQRVFVALGCNLGDRVKSLQKAVLAIENLVDTQALRVSSFYETDPMGPSDQPDYINAVCEFYTACEAHNLLDKLQQIEAEFGRVRTNQQWSARTLDLDIALYGQHQIKTPRLTVPHAGIADRSFVLWPLAELDANLVIPGKGIVSELAPKCPQYGIRRLQSTV